MLPHCFTGFDEGDRNNNWVFLSALSSALGTINLALEIFFERHVHVLLSVFKADVTK